MIFVSDSSLGYMHPPVDMLQRKRFASLCSLTAQMERKIAALTAMNSALTVENEDLRSQLEAHLDGATGDTSAADLKELQEEFSKRLGTADRNVSELRVRFSWNYRIHMFPHSMFHVVCDICSGHPLNAPFALQRMQLRIEAC
jgi:regulator of replication initiation timing